MGRNLEQSLNYARIGGIVDSIAVWLRGIVACVDTPWRRILLGMAVFCLASSALFAQVTPAAPSPQVPTQTAYSSTYDFDADAIMTSISTAANKAVEALRANAGLTGYGTTISAALLVALLVWSLVKNLAIGGGMGELIADVVELTVAFVIVKMMLDKSIGDALVGFMDGVAATIGGSNMETLEAAMRSIMTPIFKSISAVVDMPRIGSAPDSGGVLDQILGSIATAPNMVVTFLLKALTILFLIFSGVIAAAHIITGFFSLQLVLVLAPIMVPWLMWRPTAWIFDSWLRFLLGACMLKIVLGILLMLVGNLMEGMLAVANQISREVQLSGTNWLDSLQFDIVLHGMLMLFALLAGLLIMQAPGLAAGLLSGNAGGAGFSGLKALMTSVGMRAAGVASSGAAKGAGKAASAATAPVRAGVGYEAGRVLGTSSARAGGSVPQRSGSTVGSAAFNAGAKRGHSSVGAPMHQGTARTATQADMKAMTHQFNAARSMVGGAANGSRGASAQGAARAGGATSGGGARPGPRT